MFILGHAGVGKALADRLTRSLPVVPLLIGTLLPDLIDKPLYYSGLWPFITSTRSFGHTGLLLLLLATIAWSRGSLPLKALVVGMATHMVLDVGMDAVRWPDELTPALIAPLWPLLGVSFWINQTDTITEHLWALAVGPIIAGELLGSCYLILSWRRQKRTKSASRIPS